MTGRQKKWSSAMQLAQIERKSDRPNTSMLFLPSLELWTSDPASWEMAGHPRDALRLVSWLDLTFRACPMGRGQN